MVDSIHVPEPTPEFFTEEEFGKLLAGTRAYSRNTERNVAMMEFIYASGCRRAEVSALDVDRLILEKDPFATVKMGKGRRDRLVLLGDRFVKAWSEYAPVRARALARWERPQEKAAFCTNDGKRIDPETIYYTVRRLCEYAGVRVLYPHAIRHSAATHMLNNGDTLLNIKEQLGHRSLSTTQVYLHVALESRRAAYRKSHPGASASPPASPDTSGPGGG